MAVVIIATCPECGADIELVDPILREIVECPDCGEELEISQIKGNAAELGVAEIEGDDWGE